MDIRIDRLRLRVSGMHPDAARDFGRLLAEHLAAELAAGPPGQGPPRLARLNVAVPGSATRHPGSVGPAEAATEISRTLRGGAAGRGPATR